MLHEGLTHRAVHAAGIILLALWAASASAQSASTAPGDVFSTRKDTRDGSTSGTVGARLPTAWDARLGLDVATAPPPAVLDDPYRPPQAPGKDTGSGSAWANATLPGLGWDKTALEARLDPAQERGKLTTTLSRSVPLGDALSLTVQNSYAVTRSLASETASAVAPAAAAAAPDSWETNRGMRLKILPTDTAISAGARLSSTEDKWLRTFSAEQKVYGPLSITGSVSETTTGEANKSLTAAFKTRW